jgi:S-adenosylmethionine hydrolase
LITLTTDFGYRDPFVGVIKGVILGINPWARIVDITHGISPHNIVEAAFAIEESYGYFPSGTIHVVVVDPGVGSERRPIAVSANRHTFVGPDNGVFSLIYDSPRTETFHVIHITAKHYFLKSRGGTFHGRDVFAPAAASLSKGLDMSRLGEPITDFVRLPVPRPSVGKGRVDGEVIHMDGFGNAITNIRVEDMEPMGRAGLKVLIKGVELDIKDYYAQGGDGKPHTVINSNGMLEIFIYMGSAATEMGLKTGERVAVTS